MLTLTNKYQAYGGPIGEEVDKIAHSLLKPAISCLKNLEKKHNEELNLLEVQSIFILEITGLFSEERLRRGVGVRKAERAAEI